MPDSRVYAFDHDHGLPARELDRLLGGKGAGLAEMTTALGLPVPPGFTIAVPVCAEVGERGWPADLDADIARHVAMLGRRMGRSFGDAGDPLLLAVRSGAPISMPGMLDTVLNLGLNDETVEGLSRASDDPRFAWDSYRRFLLMFATTVMGLDAGQLGPTSDADTADDLRDLVNRLKHRIASLAGRPVPTDPATQLRDAVTAVFGSWGSARARAYRRREGIAEDLGTAVNVQAMVFGNRGPDSGTGVVFTRNPSTGEAVPYGDYLRRAQGEDVVSGSAQTLDIASLADHQPGAYEELLAALNLLERHYRDMCDVEFTLEQGRLWLLQTRIGKRGAVAAVRIAVELAQDPVVALTPQEALDRVPASIRAKARAEVVASLPTTDGSDPGPGLLAQGLGASPGRATGRIVLTSEQAADAQDEVILVRSQTAPEDVAGMAASAGVLTTRGGLVSHAAVVARGWGIPAVVGAGDITILDDSIRTADGTEVGRGEIITVDGSTGCVWLGPGPDRETPDQGTTSADPDERAGDCLVAARLPHLATLERWATERETASA